MDSPIAIGLDLSLTGTGVGLVGHNDGSTDPVFECFRFGRDGKRNETLDQRYERIEAIVDEVRTVIVGDCMEYPLIAVVEAPATSTAGGSSHDRSALWWFTFKMLRKLAIPTIQVTTQTMKIYATGSGTKVDKEGVLVAMLKRHPTAPIENNDHADALTLAFMGARLAGQPVDGALPKTHLRALDKLVMP